MKAWSGAAALAAGFVVGGFALVLDSWPLWLAAAVLSALGIVLELAGGAGEEATTSQRATEPLRHSRRAGQRRRTRLWSR